VAVFLLSFFPVRFSLAIMTSLLAYRLFYLLGY